MSADEAGRIEALHRYRILDTDPEQAFDDLVLLASQICDTPIALVTLLDEDRQWFKASIGVTASETSRDVSFCAHAIQHSGLFIIPDALEDARFRDNPLVRGEPKIRFYAGARIVSREGYALGTLCVIDRLPRVLSEEQMTGLRALQRQVQAQLELRRNLQELRLAMQGIDRLGALVPHCSSCAFDVVVPARLENVSTVRGGVVELLASKGWSEEDRLKVELALDEALTNAIRHGCREDASKQVQCSVSFDARGELVIVVRDPGEGFDVGALADPLDAEHLDVPGGRGVFLINCLMDSVEFSEAGTRVEMHKRPKPAGDSGADT